MPRQHQRCYLHQETLREVRPLLKIWICYLGLKKKEKRSKCESTCIKCCVLVGFCVSQADSSLWRAPQSRRSRIQNPRIPHASKTQRDKRKETAPERQKTRTQSRGEEDHNPCSSFSYCKWQSNCEHTECQCSQFRGRIHRTSLG